jgi:hypothetical protein
VGFHAANGCWLGRRAEKPRSGVIPSGMSFAIQWAGATGSTTTRRDTPLETLSYATEMLGKGYAGVVFVDLAEGGKPYMPADFAVFYLDAIK